MRFKLIRTDSEDPQKISLQNGTHTFGRGKLLNCHDHRVSRMHGQLEVTEESLVLTALHQNPCFFIKAGTVDTQVLKQNSSERLENGDKFGVLPGSYWYEVLHCLIDEDNELETAEKNKIDTNTVDPEGRISPDTEQTVCNGDSNSDADTQILLPSETDNDKLVDKQNVTDTSNGHNADPCDESAPVNFNLNETDGNIDQSESQSLITGNQQSNDTSAEVPTEETKSPQKRTHSTDTADASDSAKRIKTEPEDVQPNQDVEPDTSDVKPDASDVKQDTSDATPDVKPDTSDMKPDLNAGQAGSSNSGDQNNAKQPSPPVPGRERCMYGAGCYRRNPQHKAHFAHPQDADWGPGPRAPCPWGAACRKRDPRHWRDHSHPPGHPQPAPAPAPAHPRPGVRHRVAGIDQQAIVVGKRRRHQIPLMLDQFISDSDDDPYHTDDESDEYIPSDTEDDSGAIV